MYETRQGNTIPQGPDAGAYAPPVLTAHDVAAELRNRIPGLPAVKLHKLLYYCQGHHLAWFGEPLFGETIEAWDMGPVVAALWRAERRTEKQAGPPVADLDGTGLNTVGYVLSRYGNLTGKDLENLSHGEDPWLDADQHRPRGGAVRIEHDALIAYFRADHDEHSPGPEVLARLRQRIAGQPPVPDSPDCVARVRAVRDEAAAELGIR